MLDDGGRITDASCGRDVVKSCVLSQRACRGRGQKFGIRVAERHDAFFYCCYMLIAVVRMDDGWLLAQRRFLAGRDGGWWYRCKCVNKQKPGARATKYLCTDQGSGDGERGKHNDYRQARTVRPAAAPGFSSQQSVVAAGALPPLQTRPTSNSHQDQDGLRRSTWITMSCS